MEQIKLTQTQALSSTRSAASGSFRESCYNVSLYRWEVDHWWGVRGSSRILKGCGMHGERRRECFTSSSTFSVIFDFHSSKFQLKLWYHFLRKCAHTKSVNIAKHTKKIRENKESRRRTNLRSSAKIAYGRNSEYYLY